MFNQIDVFFNQKLISSPNNLFSYRAYLESLLNYCPHAKESYLTASLWYNDTSGTFDASPNTAQSPYAGLVKRREFTLAGKTFDMIGHLHCDVFNQDKMLLNEVEMRLRLLQSKDAFCLMESSTSLQLNISIILLKQRFASTKSSVAKLLTLKNMKYQIS